MPQAPAVIGNLVESALGRPAHILDIDEPAPGFVELQLHAAAPPDGWHPGHEIQFRVASTLGRRYTVRTVSGRDAEHISILATTAAAGPGTAWIRRLRESDHITLLASRHRPLRENGIRRLYLGDSCTLGTIDALAQGRDGPIVAIEVPANAATTLAERWPRYLFLPADDEPGGALQAWLEHAIACGELTGLDGALCLGHAQSIQRQRHSLTNDQNLPRRAITTKPYWATGKKGL